MSYVNVVLGGNFVSVVSDTQITKSDGTVSEKEMKKFLVTDQKVLIATTGNADVAKRLFDFFEEHQGALMLDLRTDFSLPCKLIVEEHFLYDSIFTRI
ncbi:hypothetical protein WECO103172_05490 [Weissella confusa]|uniref:hypothetical protein n=2 Tax=Weissella confusa TaxID=1583 RepID=UPI001080B77A|nr:hypothetical protein [Weissella confusa]MBJ7616749.1 hypothetical protein [Weissella confusa]MBJ7698811.1 hypothetical protein [Weissella confusa]MBS7550761.1 hypothetical protein [Weissella confusa]MCQ8096604.1 hypothetical protein [Weissella confusa]MCQ8146192.1 hypothetical protein [Weissella confusa]